MLQIHVKMIDWAIVFDFLQYEREMNSAPKGERKKNWFWLVRVSIWNSDQPTSLWNFCDQYFSCVYFQRMCTFIHVFTSSGRNGIANEKQLKILCSLADSYNYTMHSILKWGVRQIFFPNSDKEQSEMKPSVCVDIFHKFILFLFFFLFFFYRFLRFSSLRWEEWCSHRAVNSCLRCHTY